MDVTRPEVLKALGTALVLGIVFAPDCGQFGASTTVVPTSLTTHNTDTVSPKS